MKNSFFRDAKHASDVLYRMLIRWVTRHFYDRVVTFGNQTVADDLGGRWISAIHQMLKKRIQHVYEADTSAILARFPMVGFTDSRIQPYSTHDLEMMIQDRIAEKAYHVPSYLNSDWKYDRSRRGCSDFSISVLVPYCTHFQFFIENLNILARSISNIASIPVEIIVVNDDPVLKSEQLEKIIPKSLRKNTKIIENSSQIGIARSLNRAVKHAKNEWLVFVDCDDLLTPDSLKILSRRVRQFPFARYISSRMIDVDDFSKTIRVRLRPERFQDFSSKGMVSGHLKAIRRDLFQEIGLLDERFDGCQDYDFALRTALIEPILFIPDYLYRYRWHGRTQSIANAVRQHRLTALLQHVYRASSVLLDPAERLPPVRIQFQGKDQSLWNYAFEAWGNDSPPLLFVEVHSEAAWTDCNKKLFVVELLKKIYETGNAFRDRHLSMNFPR